MKNKVRIMDLLKEGFKLNTLKKLNPKQISLLHSRLVKEQDATSDKTEKIKNDLMQANQLADELKSELGEEELNEWGSSDQYFFNQSIHKQLGEPKEMPSPFNRELEDAAESAVDFYWDEWEEYQTDRQGLIDHAKRGYLRSYFRDQFNMLVKMFEPMSDDEGEIDENITSSNALGDLAMQKLTGQETPHDEDDMAPDGMDDDSDNNRKMMKNEVKTMKMKTPITTLGMFEEDNEYAICMDSIQDKYGPKKTWNKNAEKKFDACVLQVGKKIKERKESIRKIEESIVSLIKDINKPSMSKKDLMDIIEQTPGTKEAPVKTPTRTRPKRKTPYQPKHKPAPKAKVEDKDLPEFLKFDNLNISFKDEEKN